MSSIIFQPLLHDPLGWKQSNSTYADTYVWKALQANKNIKLSKYGQQHQKEMKKMQKLQEINRQEAISQIISKNKSPSPVLPRSPVKTPPAVVEQSMTLPVEYKQRTPSSLIRENACGSRTSLRSSTSAEENGRAATSTDVRQSPSSKEEKEKEKEKSLIIDSNNDNSRHWLTYPNPKTPQYLIDIKQRLGHIKVPFVRPSSVAVAATTASQQSNEQSEILKKSTSPNDADQRHFLDFNLPQTPDDLRAARYRIAKYRYNPALDSYPPRPQTCPVNIDENEQVVPQPPPSATIEAESTEVKDDAWTNEDENKPVDQEASTVVVQLVDCEGMPNEYVQALETASTVQEEYYKNLKLNNDKRSESSTLRRPSTSNDNQKESFNAYRNQHQQSTNNNPISSRQNEFNTWVRSASNKERKSALKILQDVLNQPIIGYDFPMKSTKQTPPSLRANSANRKLGRTRNVHRRIPCEICEKQLIKHHIWNLNQSDSTVCLHQAQGVKPPIIQIRT